MLHALDLSIYSCLKIACLGEVLTYMLFFTLITSTRSQELGAMHEVKFQTDGEILDDEEVNP